MKPIQSTAFALLATTSVMLLSSACSRYRDDLDYSHNVVQQWSDDSLVSGELVQFEGVRYSPDDVAGLRHQIKHESITSNRRVLDLDCETGVLALLSSQQDAKYVIAIANSSAANACARYNLALQEAALADAGCQVEIRDAKLSDIVAADPFDAMLVVLDSENTQRLPEFLDAMRDGLAVGGRGWIGNPDSISKFDWDTELESRGLERHIPAPEKPQNSSKSHSSEPDSADSFAQPDAAPIVPRGNVMTLKLRRGAVVKQHTPDGK